MSETINDLTLVANSPSVDSILTLLREVTGLRIALVARVTEAEWRACAVLDDADFGLSSGDTLAVTTTY